MGAVAKPTVAFGKFRMLSPQRSIQGNYILIGAWVGSDDLLTYTKRVKPDATKDDLRKAYGQLREQIHKEHPGIKEEFTMLRPKHAYN